MPYRTVTIDTLTREEFSQPASASSYYPRNDQADHIHLGVPTASGGQTAPAGSVLVTFISLKRDSNPTAAGRLDPGPTGVFYLSKMTWTPPWNANTGWEAGWKDQLKNALGDMIQP